MIRSTRVLSLVFLLALSATHLRAQVQTGTPPFGSFVAGPDVINLANLNAHWTIPILHKTGRGLNFAFDLTYDTSVWYPVGSSGNQIWTPVSGWGWGGFEPLTGYISYHTSTQMCLDDRGRKYYYPIYSNWVYYDPLGVKHSGGALTVTYYVDICTGTSPYPDSATYAYPDGSGYTITVIADPSATVVSSTGTTYDPPVQTTTATATDRNGNQLTHDSTGHYYDTLSSTTPAVTVGGLGTPASPSTFTYTAPSGASPAYSMKYAAYTVQTAFGCSGISEVGPLAMNLVSEIDLPDYNATTNPNARYTFTYEQTPGIPANVTGRLASVQLPAGGTISYTYTGGSSGHITCADGSTSGLERTTPDGGSNYWNYARTAGTGATYTTTVTDPTSSANQTVIQFQGIYETQRQVYQGSTSGTLLATTNSCYNGSASPCNSTSITLPITQRVVITSLPGSNNLQSEHKDIFNSLGLPTESDDYDYGNASPGPLLKKVLTSYASLGNGISGMPASVTIQDGSGTTNAKTTYAYDQYPLSQTTGTPQHINFSGSHGNANIISYFVHGSTSLSQTISYYDTGTINNAYDVNNEVASYSGYTCGNSFATEVSIAPLYLSRFETWNCTGGVQTSLQDENGKTISASYTTDPNYWRPESTSDATNAATSFCYLNGANCSLNPNQIESTLTFNSNGSAVDSLTTLDSLGRTHVQQTRQGPGLSSFDTVETDYDALGRPSRVTMPYSGTAGQTSSGGPATTASYDALGRVLQVMDGGGGTVTYYYSQNDVYISVLSPSGENAKRRQLEYDALGRLTSVCEVTAGNSAGPAGNCAQNTSNTGYWTKYTYNALGNLLGVTQNAQAATGYQQTRSYTYDLMGRLTSETNPETANTAYSYTYDTDATCGNSSGDRVKRIDAVGNTTCFAYDGLHRLTSATYSGPYATNTPNKYFVYDAATINTSPTTQMQNAKGRLAEAYTATSVNGTKITDVGFSYSVRGEASDAYQSTQHESPNYYNHLTQTYWANGAANQLSSNITNLPTFTYGVDPEGRPQVASASQGQNPVTGTTFNTSSQVTQVTFGSGDSDAFSFDPNTGRMTNYQFNVNSQSVKGALTWNSNSTLQNLVITDPFNSANSQTCNYVYDDIARLSSANCGSVTGTYSYDAFGNIDKSGSFSFQPLYTNATTGQNTNRYISIPGATVSYDANGNVLSDGSNTYTWDAEGRPFTIDTVALTYDALGRMAEQNRSGAYTQIVYAPTGEKVALMSATTLQKAFIPLPGNAKAVYGSSSLSYYRHPDWLGSSRFASTATPPTAMYSDTAYAPFGEPYAQAGTADLSFTGQNQDTVAGGLTGPYDFPVREYGSQGRWVSPDPAGLAAVDPTDPQSWNRYAYVGNNPLSFVDPYGLHRCYLDDGTEIPANSQTECEGKHGTWFDDGYDSVTVTSEPGPVPTIIFWIPAQPNWGGTNNSGVIGGILDRLRNAVSSGCSVVPDAVSVGGGGDMGIGITGSGQLNLTANGSSGELTLSLSLGLSGGVIGPDAYVSASATPNAPDNSFLNTHGQPSITYNAGYGRIGYSGGGGTYGGTFGPSLLQIPTGSMSGMLSKPLINVPYLGYVAYQVRAVCRAVTGK